MKGKLYKKSFYKIYIIHLVPCKNTVALLQSEKIVTVRKNSLITFMGWKNNEVLMIIL